MLAQILSAARFSLLTFRRNPAATFFTVVFPLLFLVIFGFIFGNETLDSGAKVATFQVPGILTLAIVSATFFNLAMGMVVRRESGQLKRLRATPLRPIVWIAGQVLGSFVLVAFMTVVVTLGGRVLFDVAFNVSTLGQFVLFILLGSATFCALGLAITAVIPNIDAAPAITNLVVFPLYFVSDVFLLTDDTGGFIGNVGDFFPVKPLANLLQPTYFPSEFGTLDIEMRSIVTLAIWCVIGIALASRFFRWMPQQDRR
ncbi:MAG: ABC transporter permease [Actinomycetota bacterium]